MTYRFPESPLPFFSSGQSIARSCLDWFLILNSAGDWYNNLAQKAFFEFVSDHIPIMPSTSEFSCDPRTFSFFNIWCQDSDLTNLVISIWDGRSSI